MGNENPTYSTVRHTQIKGKGTAHGLAVLNSVCANGAQSPEVQISPIARQALADLEAAVAVAQGSLTSKMAAATAHATAVKTLKIDFRGAGAALRTYEAAVGSVAHGDGAVIGRAGLQARDQKTPPAPLGAVTSVRGKLGALSGEGIVLWPAVPGAGGYALEVSFTPADPAPTWAALGTGRKRQRLVKAPAPGAQFLARVAAVASDGTQSEWSSPILVTAR